MGRTLAPPIVRGPPLVRKSRRISQKGIQPRSRNYSRPRDRICRSWEIYGTIGSSVGLSLNVFIGARRETILGSLPLPVSRSLAYGGINGR